MMLSDDELLHIEGEPPENYDAAEARRALEQHGEAYRYQLVAAIDLEDRAQMFSEQRLSEELGCGYGPVYVDGRAHALREVAAALRRGDYLPDGWLFNSVVPRNE
jgi:hypothetical protein